MDKKQASHVEWARLKLMGKPIITGAAIGTSLVVACRTSPYLVHIFQDSHLMSVWRFPSDLNFLLIGPSRDQAPGTSSQRVGYSRNKHTAASLLVITSDGRIWLLNVSSNSIPSCERPTKKRKEEIHAELQKAAHESLITKADPESSVAPKGNQKNEGDVFENLYASCSKLEHVDVRCSQDRGRAESRPRISGNSSKDVDYTTIESRDGTQKNFDRLGLNLQWEILSVDNHAWYPNKPEVKLVSPRDLLGVLPGVSVATFGPRDFVALLYPSGALHIIQLTSSHLSKSTQVTPVRDEGPSTESRESTCLLFSSVMLEQDASIQREGNAALLSPKLFETIFGEVDKITPSYGLLVGDRSGSVYTISLEPLQTVLEASNRVLCKLSQPILAILFIPDMKNADEKHDQTRSKGSSKAKELGGDSILIIGQMGQAILITGVKEESNKLKDGPLWPVRSSSSLRAKVQSSASAQLIEKNLIIHEWDIKAPVTSACMLGPHCLCVCSGSEVQYFNLFEIVRYCTISPTIMRIGNTSATETEHRMSSWQSESNKMLPEGSSKWMGEFVSHIVPVADVVIAIAGRGILGASGGSRPLVALTAGGRLLGVEVSDHVSSPSLNDEVGIQKNWQSLQARVEDRVKELLQTVAEVTHCIDMLQNYDVSITLALKELATALPLVYDICSDQTRNVVHLSDVSVVGEAAPNKLSSFLLVTVQPSVFICPEKLSFGKCLQDMPSHHDYNSHSVKISVVLHNQSPIALSQYWSLLLELHTLYSDPTEFVSSSTVINRGLGLPVGAHFSHDFHLELPGVGFGPLLVSLSICHLHDPHQSIVDFEPPGSKFSNISSRKLKGNLVKGTLDDRGDLSNKLTISDTGKPGMCSIDDISAGKTSQGVCVLLSHYRVDVVSLLAQPTPQAGISPWTCPEIGGKSASFNDGDLLRLFSGRIILTNIEGATFQVLKGIGNIWRELYLGDLQQRGNTSADTCRISIAAPNGGRVSVSVEECVSPQGSSSISILVQASSLQLGSLMRESLLWRLSGSHCKFVLQESFAGNLLDCWNADAYPVSKDGLTNNLNQLSQQLLNLTSVWRDVWTASDSVLSAPLLENTESVIEIILKVYKFRREESPSIRLI